MNIITKIFGQSKKQLRAEIERLNAELERLNKKLLRAEPGAPVAPVAPPPATKRKTTLDFYAVEFTAIIAALIRDEKGEKRGNFLYVDKTVITTMLKRNAYATPSEKLNVWREFGWIIADEKHFTRLVRDGEQHKRKIKVDLSKYDTCNRLK